MLLLLHNMLLPILKRCLDEAARANSRSQNTQNISGERLVFEQISEQASITASWAMISLLTFYSLFFFFVHAIFLWFLFLLLFFLSAPQVSFFSEPDSTDFISLLQLAGFLKEPVGASVSLIISVNAQTALTSL